MGELRAAVLLPAAGGIRGLPARAGQASLSSAGAPASARARARAVSPVARPGPCGRAPDIDRRLRIFDVPHVR